MKIDRDFFFDKVRVTVFGGKLTKTQVDGMSAILDAVEKFGVTNPWHFGAILATARIEVGANMQPVREGFAKTDAGARAAVAKLYKAGKISRNYALPHSVTGESYYGRGYPQTTHYENYLKTGTALNEGDLFVKNPDLLLLPKWAAQGMVAMMRTGGYTGKSLSSMLGTTGTPSWKQLYDARAIINGDKNYVRDGKKIGDQFASFATDFALAFKVLPEAPASEIVKPEPTPTPVDKPTPVAYVKKNWWTRLVEWFTNLPTN